MKIIQRGTLQYEPGHLSMRNWIMDCEGTLIPQIEQLNSPQTVYRLNAAQRSLLAAVLCDIAAHYGVELEAVGASALPKKVDFEAERAALAPMFTACKFGLPQPKRPWWKRLLRR